MGTFFDPDEIRRKASQRDARVDALQREFEAVLRDFVAAADALGLALVTADGCPAYEVVRVGRYGWNRLYVDTSGTVHTAASGEDYSVNRVLSTEEALWLDVLYKPQPGHEPEFLRKRMVVWGDLLESCLINAGTLYQYPSDWHGW
jgi:hypothetical protein